MKNEKTPEKVARTYTFPKTMVDYLEKLSKKNRRSISQTVRDCITFYKNKNDVTNNTHPPHDDDEAW